MIAAQMTLHDGRFLLGKELGQGATGTVHEAWDSLLGRALAIKQLNRIDPQSLYLLKHEFRSASEITHRNLIRLGELFADDRSVFFTMELVRGLDFSAYVRSDEREALRDAPTIVRADPRDLEPSTAVRQRLPEVEPPPFDEASLRAVLLQLFEALAALHAHGKVHRDVKPSNVLIEAEGRVVLLDFGLTADVLGKQDREHGWIVGTPRYMAPEQVRDHCVGPPADAYSVGVMLHEVLAGRPPIEGGAREIMFGKQLLSIEPLALRFPHVPGDLDQLCRDLLSVDPAQRPRDEEVLRRLGADAPARLALRSGQQLFVGREAEMERLRRALARSREGPVLAIVRGESGVGKSSLVHRFIADLRAAQPDTRVLRGRCFERENISFNAIDSIVDALSLALIDADERAPTPLGDPRDMAALARVFPVLRRSRAVEWMVMYDTLPDASPHDQRRRAFRAFGHLLAELGRSSPLVVAIDDLQWADKDSLALLDELTLRPSAPPFLFVATLPPGSGLGPLADGDREIVFIDLDGLAPSDAEVLAERMLRGLDLPELDAAALAREARGHPLYLQELVQLRDLGAERPSLDRALSMRASELDERARRVLELIALAGMPTRQAVVAEAAGLHMAECLAAVDELRRAHFVRTDGTGAEDAVEPYHDRVREALARGLSRRRRGELHRALAEVLARDLREPRERAVLVFHLEQAGEHARAAKHAEEAAAQSAHALAFDQAAAFYETALRLGSHGPDARGRLLLARGRALRDAGRGREAAECFVEAAQLRSGDERLSLQVAAAEQWIASGHLDRGLALVETVLSSVGERWPRTETEALVTLAFERTALAAQGLRTERRAQHLDERERRRLELFQSIASGLGWIDPLRARIFQTRALRRILRTDAPDLLAIGLALEALLEGLEGHLGPTHVRRLVARCRDSARESTSARVRAWAELADGGTSCFLGQFTSALEPLAEAESQFADEVRNDAGALNITRILKVWTAVFRGDLRQLARWMPEYERDARRRDDRYAQVSLNLAGHVGWLVDGDLARAQSKLAQRAWSPPGGAYHIQSWYELLAYCEQTLYASGGGALPVPMHARARIERGFTELHGSHVFRRAEPIRVTARWLEARYRLALVSHSASPRSEITIARSLAAKLASERPPFAAVYAAAIRAACHTLDGDSASGQIELEVCAHLADQSALAGIVAMARRRLAELASRPSDGAAADRYFRAQGVADPARMTGMYLPGFAR